MAMQLLRQGFPAWARPPEKVSEVAASKISLKSHAQTFIDIIFQRSPDKFEDPMEESL